MFDERYICFNSHDFSWSMTTLLDSSFHVYGRGPKVRWLLEVFPEWLPGYGCLIFNASPGSRQICTPNAHWQIRVGAKRAADCWATILLRVSYRQHTIRKNTRNPFPKQNYLLLEEISRFEPTSSKNCDLKCQFCKLKFSVTCRETDFISRLFFNVVCGQLTVNS